MDNEKLRAEGWTAEGIRALQNGLDPNALPPPPSPAEALAMAVLVPEPWTSEYQDYIKTLKGRFRKSYYGDIPGLG